MVPVQAEPDPQVLRELKRDVFGRVELLQTPEGLLIRRVACGGALPGSKWVAGLLARRERRALAALSGQVGFPTLVNDQRWESLPALDGREPRRGEGLLRRFVAGDPLHQAGSLPLDFFDHLDELVAHMHACGVCHNDLHKEQNIVVDQLGYPALIDFQLASVHRPGSRAHRVRAREDLRHVQKHRRRYTRDGRGPEGSGVLHGRGYGLRRAPLSALWRRTGKPLYNWVTRTCLGTRDGEERRPSSGPWPEWTPALGERPFQSS